MLRIDVKQIPPEGLDLAEDLKPGEIHVQDGEEFVLEEGGSLRCHVELRDEDTVHVSGKLVARLGLGCGRCLEPFALPVDQQLQVFLLPHREDQGEEDEVELSERDMVVAYYREKHVDLGELVREQFYLAVPLKRLCREDCKGLCPSCGANLNETTCTCNTGWEDPRLAPLKALKNRT